MTRFIILLVLSLGLNFLFILIVIKLSGQSRRVKEGITLWSPAELQFLSRKLHEYRDFKALKEGLVDEENNIELPSFKITQRFIDIDSISEKELEVVVALGLRRIEQTNRTDALHRHGKKLLFELQRREVNARRKSDNGGSERVEIGLQTKPGNENA